MSSTPNEDGREGYSKLVNVRQGKDPSQQRVVVYVPDTRRKRSPEAEARAQARAEIKEAYKAAALAEELKMVKKQRNKLVDNLASRRDQDDEGKGNQKRKKEGIRGDVPFDLD
jgi:predicted  nucleic acid-binding Zn-ribbon protein